MPQINVNYVRANSALCPEARARKVEDLKVPGAWPQDEIDAAQNSVTRPPLPLSAFTKDAERGPHKFLRAAVSSVNDTSPAQYAARSLSSRPSLSAGRLAMGIGAAAGYLYARTGGVVVHEVLGHEILGHSAMLKFPATEPRLYWTDAVRKAAREGLPTVDPDTRFWQADWLDRMSVNGAVEGTVWTVAPISGKAIAPNDTAWTWNDPNDKALQAVLAAFTANQTERFDASAGCINAVYHGRTSAHRLVCASAAPVARRGRTWRDLFQALPWYPPPT
jgi:hypothetical protein